MSKVLITGGTGSLGRSLVEAFSKVHDDVCFQYCRNEVVAKRLESLVGARPIRLDFENSFAFPETDFDVLVNNAGINISDGLTMEVPLSDWDRTIRVNLTAPFSLITQCLPHMITKRWGRIINISSIYGLRAVEGNLPYTVSKHGLSGLTKTVAKEYAAYGITCNEICPGPIDSDMMRDIAVRASGSDERALDDYFAEVCEEIPAKRLAKTDEVAALAVFLASSQACYVNGASVPIDGAMIA